MYPYNPYDSRYDRRGRLIDELIELDEIEAEMEEADEYCDDNEDFFF